MTIQELIQKLQEFRLGGDQEYDHYKADQLLLEYINNKEVKEAFEAIPKWYA